MSKQPAIDLSLAILDIEDILNTCSAEIGGNAWDQLVRNCKDGSVDQRFVKPVEEQISKYIASLSETDKRQIWSQTETGQLNSIDSKSWDIGGIEMDLDSELLAEVLDHAFRLAVEIRPK